MSPVGCNREPKPDVQIPRLSLGPVLHRRFDRRSDTLSLMCRSIKVLRDYDHPVATEDIEAAASQFVRKISGFNKPSKVNAEPFDRAVREITEASRRLLGSVTPSR